MAPGCEKPFSCLASAPKMGFGHYGQTPFLFFSLKRAAGKKSRLDKNCGAWFG